VSIVWHLLPLELSAHHLSFYRAAMNVLRLSCSMQSALLSQMSGNSSTHAQRLHTKAPPAQNPAVSPDSSGRKQSNKKKLARECQISAGESEKLLALT